MSHEIFKLKENSNQRLPIELLYISHSRYDNQWHSTLHNHHFTELFYIMNGSGFFLFEKESIKVKRGDFVVINPNIDHTEKSSEDNDLEYIALGFDGLSFSLPENEHLLPGILLNTEKNRQYSTLLIGILDEVKRKDENFEMVCQNLLEVLILMILREGKYSLTQTEEGRMNSNIYSVKRYIDQFYKSDITLDKLAEISHMSKFYMAHSFKEAMKYSPIEYLTKIRLKEAKILLESTNHSIAEVAEMTGFSSPSYFSQSFKKELKQTPFQYRKDTQVF